MGDQRAAVSGLRSLLAEMGPRTAGSDEGEAWQAFNYHQAQVTPPLEQTPRGRQTRAINRISGRFIWGPDAVVHFLDTRGATYLADLSAPQLEDLHERMLAYEEAAVNGWSSPDDPAAC